MHLEVDISILKCDFCNTLESFLLLSLLLSWTCVGNEGGITEKNMIRCKTGTHRTSSFNKGIRDLETGLLSLLVQRSQLEPQAPRTPEDDTEFVLILDVVAVSEWLYLFHPAYLPKSRKRQSTKKLNWSCLTSRMFLIKTGKENLESALIPVLPSFFLICLSSRCLLSHRRHNCLYLHG